MSLAENVKLTLLKQDVGVLGNSKDDYLKHLLKLSENEMNREGIKKEDSTEYDGLNIQYAAYLFRKRASNETTMPRFLRFSLNNLLISQKARKYNCQESGDKNDV